jgi:hypothetical protein
MDRRGGGARSTCMLGSRPHLPARPLCGSTSSWSARAPTSSSAPRCLLSAISSVSWSAKSAILPGSLVIASCWLVSAGCSPEQVCLRCCRARRPCSTAIWSATGGPPSAIALHAHALRDPQRRECVFASPRRTRAGATAGFKGRRSSSAFGSPTWGWPRSCAAGASRRLLAEAGPPGAGSSASMPPRCWRLTFHGRDGLAPAPPRPVLHRACQPQGPPRRHHRQPDRRVGGPASSEPSHGWLRRPGRQAAGGQRLRRTRERTASKKHRCSIQTERP